LTIEFTHTQERLPLQREATYDCVSSISPEQSPTPPTCGEDVLLRYSKDTQHCNQHANQRLPGRRAAQPCSYIYPIYSVVKNHESGICHYRALGRLEHFCPRLNLRTCLFKLKGGKRLSLG